MGICELGKGEFVARDGSEFCFNVACRLYTSQECQQSAFYQRGVVWPEPKTVGKKAMEKERKKRSGRKRR